MPTDNILEIGARVTLTNLKAGMDDMVATTQASTQKVSQSFKEMATETEFSMHEAKGSMALLSEEIGVKIPRHLRGFIAEMPGVGAALSSAFSAIAIVALLEVLNRVVEKFVEWQESAEKIETAWFQVDETFRTASQHIQSEIDNQEKKFIELTEGPVAALRFALQHLGDGVDTILGEISKEAEATGKAMKESGSSWTTNWANAGADVQKFQRELTQVMQTAHDANPQDSMAGFAAGMELVSDKTLEVQKRIAQLRAVSGSDPGPLIDPYEKQLEFLQKISGEMQKQVDLDREKQKVAGAELGKAEASQAKKAAEAGLKLADQRIKKKEKDFDEEFKLAQQNADESTKVEQQQTDEYLKLQDIKIGADEKHQVAKLGIEQQFVEAQFALHQISAEKEAELLTDLENRRYAIERKALEDRKALEEELDPNNVTKLAETDAQIEALADRHEAQLTTIHRKAIEERSKDDAKLEKQEDKIADRMSKNMVRFFDSTVLQSKSFHDAMNKVFLDLEKAFLNSLVQMLAKYIAHKVAKLEVAQTAQQTEVAITAQGTAESEGIENVAAFKSIFRSAAKGAAASFEKVMAAVPFPANVVLAPLAAAGTFAAITAFGGGIGSAEGGWDIPAGVNPLAQLHEKEMVLPAPLAEGVRAMAGQSDTVANLDRDIHVHFNASIQALDSQSFERVLQKHSQTMARQLVRIFRNGNLKMDYALR